MDIHGISKDIQCIYQAYAGGLHIRGIYQAYARHIPKIGVPDEGSPAGLLASDSGTGPHIEPNPSHTKALAGSFTAACQHP